MTSQFTSFLSVLLNVLKVQVDKLRTAQLLLQVIGRFNWFYFYELEFMVKLSVKEIWLSCGTLFGFHYLKIWMFIE